METGRASKTALGVAIRRAAHQIMERPRILDDPIALRLIGSGFARGMERAMHPVGRDFRAFMAVRSRYVEDQLAAAVAQGVTQYVVLGAGLETFAYRNPFPELRVFGSGLSRHAGVEAGDAGRSRHRAASQPDVCCAGL
jgi:methyltransferase (TIGR00027 family)